MTGLRRSMLAIALLITGALVVGLVQFVAGDDDDLVVVRGTLSTEKDGFMNNPEVQEILADRYGLRVEHDTAGSLEIFEIMESDPANRDFLWPASQIAGDGRYDPAPNQEEIFYSPIVLYTWGPVADALVAAGVVEQFAGTYYVTDLPRLVALVDAGTPWADLGLPRLPGTVGITTTNPTTSNSGNSFAGLLAITYNGGWAVDEATVAGVLGRVQAYYDRLAPLGPLEPSSGDLFQRFVEEGMEAYPLIAGYESSLIEISQKDEARLAQVRSEMRILYPRPTVLSSHPMIALTPNGERLLSALMDDDLQQIARERHGYRIRLLGVPNDPTFDAVAGVPATIDSVMPLPRAAVMRRITEALTPVVPPAASAPADPGSLAARRRTRW